jgi:hypothetical protein
MKEELLVHAGLALVLQGETIKITVGMAGLPRLATTLRRKIHDPHRLPHEAISIKGTSGKLIVPLRDAEQLLQEVLQYLSATPADTAFAVIKPTGGQGC